MSQIYTGTAASERGDEPQDGTVTRFSYAIGRTRFVVLLAVIVGLVARGATETVISLDTLIRQPSSVIATE